jgi:hypothetical protein
MTSHWNGCPGPHQCIPRRALSLSAGTACGFFFSESSFNDGTAHNGTRPPHSGAPTGSHHLLPVALDRCVRSRRGPRRRAADTRPVRLGPPSGRLGTSMKSPLASTASGSLSLADSETVTAPSHSVARCVPCATLSLPVPPAASSTLPVHHRVSQLKSNPTKFPVQYAISVRLKLKITD